MAKRPTFGQQFVALLKRNLLLKRKNLNHLLSAVLIPLLLVILFLFLFKQTLEVKDAIPNPIGSGQTWFQGDSSILDKWLILPKNNFTETMAKEIKITLRSFMRILRPIDITFEDNNNTIFNVTLFFDEINDLNINYTLKFFVEEMDPINPLIYLRGDTFGTITNCRDEPFNTIRSQKSKMKCPEMSYYFNGYLFVQTLIDSTIIRINSTNASVIPSTELFIYPKPLSKSSIYGVFLLVAGLLTWMFSLIIPFMVSELVKEKEKRIKEAMFMMGLRPTVYWLVWFTLEALLIFIISLIMSTFIFASNFVPEIHISLIFVLMFLVGISFIEIAAFISMFFNKELTSSQVIPLLSFLFIPPILITYFQLPLILCYLTSLYTPISLALGLKSVLIIVFINESELSLYNMFYGSDFPIGVVLVIMIFDIIIYAFLTLYLDKVLPGKYGIRHNICFFLDKNYWFPSKQPLIRDKSTEINDNFEEISDELKDKGVIVIDKISKRFNSSKVLAVNNISLTIYESQVTALIGHNGAGKTTLMNMLLGAIQPTSGTAYIYGSDVTNPSDMSNLRSMFGVCLQENILFDELDSEEHLVFFGEMKGLYGNSLREEINKLLKDIDLFGNRYTLSKDLSGGQKRKLCIAIALIADPRVVVLDEPTSGVDIAIREDIWKMIRSYKSNKTIIMTTHYMEEADVMSDRKAVISKGKLRCVGSSLFLKKKFGVGYHLTIDLNKQMDENKTKQKVKDITSLVNKEIPNSKFDAFIGSEIFYILPENESRNFPKLFLSLEEMIESEKHIKSYGISMTTLEEVFLKLEDESIDQNNGSKEDLINNKPISMIDIKYNPSFWKSFFAFLRIKLLLLSRNLKTLLSMIITSVLLVIYVYVFTNIPNYMTKSPKPLLLSPEIYDKIHCVLRYQNKTNKNLLEFSSIIEEFGVKPQLINDLSLQSLNNSYMSLVIDNFEKDLIDWKWYFNETHIYSLPILHNLMANTYSRFKTGINKRITTSIMFKPKIGFDFFNLVAIILVAYFIWLIQSSFCLSSSLELVDDRETKVIDTIRISGMGFYCYFLTNLFFHSLFIFSYIAVLTIMFSFLVDISIFTNVFFYIIQLLSIITLLLMDYVLGHLISSKPIVQMLLLPQFLGTIIFVSIVVGLYKADPLVAYSMTFLFTVVFPPLISPLGSIILYFVDTHLISEYVLIFPICGALVSIFLYLYLLKVVDKMSSGDSLSEAIGLKVSQTEFFPYISSLEDNDVIRERDEVITVFQTHKNIPILLVNGLRKVFYQRMCLGLVGKQKEQEIAVNNLSFMVRENNIFGLLGPNGAGKTTTMKMIIKQEKPTNGVILINGQNLESNYLHKQIGYCSQQDTLFKNITLKEHLILFANIRGIDRRDINKICDNFMNNLKIKEHENKYSDHLSGGTKRKLCYIMSLMGPSDLVLLDEPSTGMDPHSKRFLWKTIQKTFCIGSHKSAILTTHSMEEANALCTRIAILTKGVMRCIGSVQHLKNKYGAGYILIIKWNPSLTKSDSIKQMVSSIFKEWKLKEESEDRLTADVSQQSVKSLSTIFLNLEEMKRNPSNGIQDYSFSQTTLEQVFIYFAKQNII